MPDRSRDEPGSWRGDSGRTLSAGDNRKVDAACDRIGECEARITTRLESFEQVASGELVGKDHRLKGRDRFKDKVAAAAEGASGADLDRVMTNIHDTVRYTLQYDDDGYTGGVHADVELMKGRGFHLIKLRNSWSEVEYKGVNSQWQDRETGQAFELQFHTSISFEAKQMTHEAYERLRSRQDTDTKYAENGELHTYQQEVCVHIPVPPRALTIPDYP